MANLVKAQERSLQVVPDSPWTANQYAIIKNQIAKGCSDGELALFGQVCKRTGLDPFIGQIYAISRNTYNPETKQKEPKMTIQVSIDGLRLAADRSGQYSGSETYWCGADGQWVDVWLSPAPPAAAKTLVYKRGCDRPFVGVAKFESYKQDFNGKLSGQWAKMPEVMIAKCSEALALRKGFPAELAGIDEVTPDNSSPPTADFDVEPITFQQNRAWKNFVTAIGQAETEERITEIESKIYARIREGKIPNRDAAFDAAEEEVKRARDRVAHKGYSQLPKYLEAVQNVTDPDEADTLSCSALGDLAGDDLKEFQEAMRDRLSEINKELDEALAE